MDIRLAKGSWLRENGEMIERRDRGYDASLTWTQNEIRLVKSSRSLPCIEVEKYKVYQELLGLKFDMLIDENRGVISLIGRIQTMEFFETYESLKWI